MVFRTFRMPQQRLDETPVITFEHAKAQHAMNAQQIKPTPGRRLSLNGTIARSQLWPDVIDSKSVNLVRPREQW